MWWLKNRLSFHQTFFDNSCYNINVYSTKSFLKFVYSRKQLQSLYLILQVLQIFIIMSIFTFNFMNPFSRIITRFGNELAINLTRPMNCHLYDIVFVTYFPSSSLFFFFFFFKLFSYWNWKVYVFFSIFSKTSNK